MNHRPIVPIGSRSVPIYTNLACLFARGEPRNRRWHPETKSELGFDRASMSVLHAATPILSSAAREVQGKSSNSGALPVFYCCDSRSWVRRFANSHAFAQNVGYSSRRMRGAKAGKSFFFGTRMIMSDKFLRTISYNSPYVLIGRSIALTSDRPIDIGDDSLGG